MRNLVLLSCALLAGLTQDGAPPAAPPKQGNARPAPQDQASYIGAIACRSCHRVKAKGEQFVHWSTKTPHPGAFERLATEEARAVAARLGVAEPQKDPACLRCHTTASGVDSARVEKTFRAELGVQCESCHGPGGWHRQQRLEASGRLAPEEAARQANTTIAIPEGEIRIPTEETCRACHNPDSPTFKPYDHKVFLEKVAHRNPQRKRQRPDSSEGAR